MPGKDNLLYEVGLKQKIITDKEPQGPKAETRADLQALITMVEVVIVKHKIPIENYKTRKKIKKTQRSTEHHVP